MIVGVEAHTGAALDCWDWAAVELAFGVLEDRGELDPVVVGIVAVMGIAIAPYGDLNRNELLEESYSWLISMTYIIGIADIGIGIAIAG